MSEVSSDERSDNELELDDPDEPIMKGSDDDFSDLSSVESEEEDEDHSSPCTQAPPPTIAANRPNPDIQPTTVASPTSQSTDPSSTNGPDSTSQPTSWSSDLHPVTINPFTSSVGPAVPIAVSPLDVFTFFISFDLMEEITNEE